MNLIREGGKKSKQKKSKMEAVDFIVESQYSGQFLLKMGKHFNTVAKNHNLSNRELFAFIFDHVLSSLTNPEDGQRLVASIKFKNPRVTLLLDRKQEDESLEIFRNRFTYKAVHYLTSNQDQKNFQLIMCIEYEK